MALSTAPSWPKLPEVLQHVLHECQAGNAAKLVQDKRVRCEPLHVCWIDKGGGLIRVKRAHGLVCMEPTSPSARTPAQSQGDSCA